MDENIYYVYVHYRASDNTPFYVGKGHGKRYITPYGRNRYWVNISSKHGWYAELIFTDLSEKEALDLEVDTIKELKYFGYTLANITQGGDGVSGYKHSQAAKQAMSDRLKLVMKDNTERRSKMIAGVRRFYQEGGRINRKWTDNPWLHPNAIKAQWLNLDLFYQYYRICGATQSNLEAVFPDFHFETVVKLFKSGFIPEENLNWIAFRDQNLVPKILEKPRNIFYEIKSDFVFENLVEIEKQVLSGDGYIKISQKFEKPPGMFTRVVRRIKDGRLRTDTDKFRFIQNRLTGGDNGSA